MSQPPARPPQTALQVQLAPVSPKLALVRIISGAPPALIILTAILIAGFGVWNRALPALAWMTWTALAIWLVVVVWVAIVIIRQVTHLGYAQRPADLLIERGIMFRRTTLVPYGRLQFVDVIAGPIDRIFGLAAVKLHTASAASDAVIPGLPRAQADSLRESLAARGEADLAGL